jgi:hypothetical protein
VWRDPASGYVRRNVSPPGAPQPMQIVEVEFPARARGAVETAARDLPIAQHIRVLARTNEITHGRPTMSHNPPRRPARYGVVSPPDPLRR